MENSEGRDPQEKERIHLLSEEVTKLRRMRSELPDTIRRLEIDRNALLQVIRERDARIAELEKEIKVGDNGIDNEPDTFRYTEKSGSGSNKKAKGATR